MIIHYFFWGWWKGHFDGHDQYFIGAHCVFFVCLGSLESRTQLFEIGMTGGEVSHSKVSRVEREFQRKS